MPRRNKGPHLHWRADRKVWEIRWFEQGQKRSRSTGTEDLAEAQGQFEEFKAGQKTRKRSDPTERHISGVLADYIDEKASAVKDTERLLNSCAALLPFWEGKLVDEITETTCRAYCASRGVSDGTLIRELGTLKSALEHDFKEKRLSVQVYVWKPRKPDPKDRWLTRSEAIKLLNTARKKPRSRHYLPLFILIGLYTGARKEAILSLRWAQVDLDRKRIDFNPPGRERTNKGRPIIPIPRRLMTPLKLARKRGTDTGFVVHDTRRVLDDNGKPTGKFTQAPLKDIKKAFRDTAAEAGFLTGRTAKGTPQTDVTPHVLRHTCITWMVQRRVPYPEIADYVGHEDSRITERVYGHHSPDYMKSAISAFD